MGTDFDKGTAAYEAEGYATVLRKFYKASEQVDAFVADQIEPIRKRLATDLTADGEDVFL